MMQSTPFITPADPLPATTSVVQTQIPLVQSTPVITSQVPIVAAPQISYAPVTSVLQTQPILTQGVKTGVKVVPIYDDF